MTTWGMYWFTRLDYIQGLGKAGAFVGGLSLVILILVSTIEKTDHAKKWGLKVGTVFVVFLILAVFTPTQKDAAAIWLIPKMINNEQVGNIAANSLSILESKTKEYLDDLAEIECD